MNKVTHFLADLAVNPQKQAAFMSNPSLNLTASELSEATQAHLQTMEYVRITEAVIDELMADELTAVLGTCTAADPGPDPMPDPDPPPMPPPFAN